MDSSNIEVFWHDGTPEPGTCWTDDTPAGWYWWTCSPGCLPDGEPIGPFDTEREALDAAEQP